MSASGNCMQLVMRKRKHHNIIRYKCYNTKTSSLAYKQYKQYISYLFILAEATNLINEKDMKCRSETRTVIC